MEYINTDKLQLIQLNRNNFYAVLDFDRTITSNDSIDSWSASAIESVAGKEIVKKIDELFNKYYPIELDYTITKEEKTKSMEKWYKEVMDLYYTYNLTYEKLTKSVESSNLILRQGIKELLDKLHKNNIPVIIVSAGIGNVIVKFLKDNNIHYSNIHIISNFIEFNEDGTMIKFEKEMLHSINKKIKGHINKNIQGILDTKKYKILVGDLIEDKIMLPEKEWENSILIGIVNTKSEKNIEQYNKNFDIVLSQEDATFETINDLILNFLNI